MDDSFRGKLQPYMGALMLISTIAGLVVVGVGGFYLVLNRYIDNNWPVDPRIKRAETRKLLRGAAMREHIAPDPKVAYVFLLHALEQIYKDGELADGSEPVQELVVRLAHAAYAMGEQEPARKMLEDAWAKVVDDKGNINTVKQQDGQSYSDKWALEQVCRVADVLGPALLTHKDHENAINLYGTALRAAKIVNDNLDTKEHKTDDAVAAQKDDLLLKQVNYATSLGEAFALKGDFKTSKMLLGGVLQELKEKTANRDAKLVDKWTCLDAIVMLDLAQISQQIGDTDNSKAWTIAGLQTTNQREGVRACDNCQSHLLYHLGMLMEGSGDEKKALGIYKKALEHSRKTNTGSIEQIKTSIDKIKEKMSAE
ncbi:hypothetical protein GGI25_006397 [Coemansia spiralis]|uniref:Uncharacterized protein n=2 Tax=Coemansia TaxID=4863 RepID=A0A9W8KTR7_9FUNG|nr:hypothetical protein BX070DRAFT_236946 [Coemansia spiralis]KAJ1986170.1 hypothetical protein EDC05_006390 [Coemansia umbellata]KAJ2618646.1 hypothetical protein GGI26_006446 [Coemansia sp. RSA 1358]KAJ2668649.1 hypothetical protein GGI25_006397 [Coemansia spiralis]